MSGVRAAAVLLVLYISVYSVLFELTVIVMLFVFVKVLPRFILILDVAFLPLNHNGMLETIENDLRHSCLGMNRCTCVHITSRSD